MLSIHGTATAIAILREAWHGLSFAVMCPFEKGCKCATLGVLDDVQQWDIYIYIYDIMLSLLPFDNNDRVYRDAL